MNEFFLNRVKRKKCKKSIISKKSCIFAPFKIKYKKYHSSMNRNKLFFLLLILLTVSISSVNAQIFREADYAFKHCQYEKALAEYQKNMKKVSRNPIESKRGSFQIAECYRIMGNLKKAEQQYIRLEKKNYQKDNPMILFHLGSIYQLRGEYDMALKYFNNYKKRVPDDSRVDVRIDGCNKAKTWMENPTRYEVENFKKLNSKQDDWAARWGNTDKCNQIIFTSNREGSNSKGVDQWTGYAFSDIYKTDKPKSKKTEWPGEWSPVMPLDEGETLNSAVNEGEACGNKKGSVIYFTKCPQDKKQVMGCYIYSSAKKGKTFGDAEKIELGLDSFNYVYPYITPDELTLYFSSNMPGGYGGYDLYKATRAKKSAKFKDIKNLGSLVNTAGQEVYPAMRGDSLLYFSSDGHPGMGGLDLFVSELKNGVFQAPENLMVPINSCWDEIGIIFDESQVIDPKSKVNFLEKGYFSSNRPGGRGGDDIYYFLLRPVVFTLAGYVRNESTLRYIDGAEVEIVGTDGTSYKTQTDVKGYYFFDKAKILGKTTYTMKVTKPKYWQQNNTATITTIGLTENTDLKQDFVLTPIPPDPILLPEILYDLAKWDLKEQYKDSLMYLYNVLVKNPTLVVELRSHTDSRDTEIKNETLSQKRAQTCVDFLVSKGIDPARIVPKGYGEYRPRVLEKNTVSRYNGKTYTFAAGTKLTEQYCESFSTKAEKEAAHALNRRTEFIVLRDDYVPKSDTSLTSGTTAPIAVIQQRTVPVQIENDMIKSNCFANNKSMQFVIGDNSDEIFMNYADATRFLEEMIINVSNFEMKDRAIKPEDGSIIENVVLYLNEIRIGDDYAENVKVIVKKGLPSAFVIGDKFISEEWGDYVVDKDKKMIIFNK